MADAAYYASRVRPTTGKDTAAVVQEALTSPRLFVFGELLSEPAVAMVCCRDRYTETPHAHPVPLHSSRTTPSSSRHTISCTCSRTVPTVSISVCPRTRLPAVYRCSAAQNLVPRFKIITERRHTLPGITPAQLKKLKQLTLVSLASKARNISYDVLQRELDIPDVRVLEDVIIDSITSGLLQGKLDQASRSLEVVDVIGRDVQRSDLDGMIATLGAWAESSTTAINELDRMIRRAKVAEDSRTVCYLLPVCLPSANPICCIHIVTSFTSHPLSLSHPQKNDQEFAQQLQALAASATGPGGDGP